MDLRFDNHPGFHRATLAMVTLGAGLSALSVPLASRLSISPTLVGGALGIALGAGVAYGGLRGRALLGVLACVPIALSTTWAALAAAAVLVGVAVALGAGERKRTAIAAFVGGTAALVASWASVRIFYAQETSAWAPVVTAMVGGGAMGLVGAMATVPRHLGWERDPVSVAAAALPANIDPEVQKLCQRAIGIWAAAKDRLHTDVSSRDLLRSGVLKVLEVAHRATVGLTNVPPASEQELAARIEDLDQRIAAATDAETKAQYQAARDGLDDQRKYRDRLRASRERTVARLHNHVAALEKLQLAAASLLASKDLGADDPLVKQLAELSSDVSASGDALAEVAPA